MADWSLTQQRKKVNQSNYVQWPSAKEQYSPAGNGRSCSRRAKTGSRSREADKFRPQYRDRTCSPLRRRRDELAEPARRSPRIEPERVQSGRRDGEHGSIQRRDDESSAVRVRTRGRRSGRRSQHSDHYTSGRLFYEDDDDDIYFTITETPLASGVAGSPVASRVNVNEKTSQSTRDELPIRFKASSCGDSSPYSCQRAAAEAESFLDGLREQIREDMVQAACSREMSIILDKVCSEEDPPVSEHSNGGLRKNITSPPFCDEVVRLFANRPNPVIRVHSKRPLAAEFLDDDVHQMTKTGESSHCQSDRL